MPETDICKPELSAQLLETNTAIAFGGIRMAGVSSTTNVRLFMLQRTPLSGRDPADETSRVSGDPQLTWQVPALLAS